MSAPAHPRLTEEDYLALENAAEFKSEFYDGVMYAMAGTTPTHSLVTANLTAELRQALKQRPCLVYVSDLRVRSNRETYTYPDISVVCGEPRFAEKDRNTLSNPTVLIEVLSPSTESHDRGLKFHRYQQIESLKEYVQISQDQARVETYLRQASGSWLYSDVAALGSSVIFASLDCTIPLAEIYHQVEFPE